jgi:hypothetical protein
VSAFGFSCFNCPESVEAPHRDARQARRWAGERGWVLGHVTGQAYIACPHCAGALFDARALGDNAG